MIAPIYRHIQDENRRLRKLNTEMLAVLKAIVNGWHDEYDLDAALGRARIIIAKAELEL